MKLTQITTTNDYDLKPLATVAFSDANAETEQNILNLFPEVTDQTILGFGGSFTGSLRNDRRLSNGSGLRF